MRRSSPTRCRSPHNHGASPPSPPSPPPLLPPVSLLDCCAFCVCLAPQLLMQAGVWATFVCILRALPFLVFQMPVDVARRQWTARALRRQQQQKEQQQSPSVFEDVVLCCVRWAFVHVPPHVGRVFFSRPVALPFFLFRQHHQQQQQQQQQHRSGYAGVWRTICAVADYVLSLMRSLPELFSASSALGSKDLNNNPFKGMWITHDATRPADIVIFFVHGGGFVLGSSHFYLEFLRAWLTLLMENDLKDRSTGKRTQFTNPAIYSLDYTLAPDAVFPTQLDEALHAYSHVVSTTAQQSQESPENRPPRVVMAGDSAGGAIVLSLLLKLSQERQKSGGTAPPMPRMPRMPDQAVLISPWVSLWSHRYGRSANDYIDAVSLAGYAAQYVGSEVLAAELAAEPRRIDPLLSPGHCRDKIWWHRASPSRGLIVTYGAEEVFAPEIRDWVEMLQAAGVPVQTGVDPGGGLGVHAWPVASLFLARTSARRYEGLCRIVELMRR